MTAGGMDMGIGEGAAVGGAVLNSVGQMQGFRALAREKRKQLAEQQAIQAEADKDMGATIGNNNPSLLEERTIDQMARPGEEYLQSLQGYKPLGMGAAASAAMVPAQQADANQISAANIRLARQNAQGQTQIGMRVAAAELGDKQAGHTEKSRRLAALYDLRDQAAASEGAELRGAGNMLQAAGGVAGGFQGSQEAGSGSPQQSRRRRSTSPTLI